jgi:hypothetical protein
MAQSIFSCSLSPEIARKFELESHKSALIESLLIRYYADKASVIPELQAQITELTYRVDFLKSEQEKEEKVMSIADAEGKEQYEIDAKERWQGYFKLKLGRELTNEEYSLWKKEHYEAGVGFDDFLILHGFTN